MKSIHAGRAYLSNEHKVFARRTYQNSETDVPPVA